MPRYRVKWNYSNMKSQSAGIDGSNGVFGFTAGSMWEAVPTMNVLQRLGLEGPSFGNGQRSPKKMRFALIGSPHKYLYDVQSTGIASCHVALADRLFANIPTDQAPIYFMEFDLPDTAEDDFTSVLEKLGGEKAKHPYYDTDQGEFAEDVTLRGTMTRIAFRGIDH
jgi:hypothetical protein